jgi:hypothetical protein
MKTVPLRTLLREPLKIKKMTRAGETVEVADSGEALWIIHPAKSSTEDEAERIRAIDELLDEVLRSSASRINLSKIVIESRR